MSKPNLPDSWNLGASYELFMGRWSRLVARSFVAWLAPAPQRAWLDVGCGSGALSEAIITQAAPIQLTAVDQSDGFVRDLQNRLRQSVICKVGNAVDLPVADGSVDLAVSGLVLNFVSQPDKALTEMQRVTVPGGTVAIYIWDYAGQMESLSKFWDAAARLDPKAAALDESRRFADFTPERLCHLFEDAGLADIKSSVIDIETFFSNFDDYWTPFLGGQGPAPTYVASLEPPAQDRLRDQLRATLPTERDGSIRLAARALAIRATRVS